MLIKLLRTEPVTESGACPHCARLRNLEHDWADWSEYGGPRIAELREIERPVDTLPHPVTLHLSNGEGLYWIKLYHLEEQDEVSEWYTGYEQRTYWDTWARFGG
jgi:hypothetical protein